MYFRLFFTLDSIKARIMALEHTIWILQEQERRRIAKRKHRYAREEMYAELQTQVESIKADNEQRWNEVRAQVPALLTEEIAAFILETITAKELAQ